MTTLALYNLGVNLGDSLGPILGGYLTEKKGFEFTCFSICLLNVIVFALFILSNLNTIDTQLSVKDYSEKVIGRNTSSSKSSMFSKRSSSNGVHEQFDNENDNRNFYNSRVSANQYYISFSKRNKAKSIRPKMSFLENIN